MKARIHPYCNLGSTALRPEFGTGILLLHSVSLELLLDLDWLCVTWAALCVERKITVCMQALSTQIMALESGTGANFALPIVVPHRVSVFTGVPIDDLLDPPGGLGHTLLGGRGRLALLAVVPSGFHCLSLSPLPAHGAPTLPTFASCRSLAGGNCVQARSEPGGVRLVVAFVGGIGCYWGRGCSTIWSRLLRRLSAWALPIYKTSRRWVIYNIRGFDGRRVVLWSHTLFPPLTVVQPPTTRKNRASYNYRLHPFGSTLRPVPLNFLTYPPWKQSAPLITHAQQLRSCWIQLLRAHALQLYGLRISGHELP